MKILSILALVLLMSCTEAFAEMKCETARDGAFIRITKCKDEEGICYIYNGRASCFPTPKSKN